MLYWRATRSFQKVAEVKLMPLSSHFTRETAYDWNSILLIYGIAFFSIFSSQRKNWLHVMHVRQSMRHHGCLKHTKLNVCNATSDKFSFKWKQTRKWQRTTAVAHPQRRGNKEWCCDAYAECSLVQVVQVVVAKTRGKILHTRNDTKLKSTLCEQKIINWFFACLFLLFSQSNACSRILLNTTMLAKTADNA